MSFLDRLHPWRYGLLPRRSAAPLDRPRPSASARRAAGRTGAAPSAGPDRRALVERRSEALRALFPLLFSRYARRSDLWQAIAIERYLSQALTLPDLEQRILEVQRRRVVPLSG